MEEKCFSGLTSQMEQLMLKDSSGNTPLLTAAKFANNDIVKLFIEDLH